MANSGAKVTVYAQLTVHVHVCTKGESGRMERRTLENSDTSTSITMGITWHTCNQALPACVCECEGDV